jgi:guanylate kinase
MPRHAALCAIIAFLNWPGPLDGPVKNLGGRNGAQKTGQLFVVSAPSGAGKTTLVNAIVQALPRVRLSVSHTTRPRRENEVDGRHYHFVTREQFGELVDQDAFLEHADVFGNCYGTSREAVQALLDQGFHVILEIDWQGARQVRRRMPDCQSIFILPPSAAELERRLRGRGTDSDEVIARRLAESRSDISHWNEFDYVIVNDELNRALQELTRIFSGEGRDSAATRPGLREFAQSLQA